MFKLAVLFSVLAVAAAKPSVVAYNSVPLAYTAALPYTAYSTVPAVSSVSQYSNSVVHGAPAVPAVYSAGYSTVPAVVPAFTTVSQAPNSPAVVLDAVNGVPLDTPEVVAARVAHYQAKALSGVHHLAKRSVVPVSYSSVVSPVAPVSPFVRSYVSPVTYSSPYYATYPAPLPSTYAYSSVVPKALSVHPW